MKKSTWVIDRSNFKQTKKEIMKKDYTKFEQIILRCMVVLLSHVVGFSMRNSANDLVDEIRKEIK